MEENLKQLLLKDLCSRFPYKVKGKVYAEVTDGRFGMMGDMIFYDAPFDVILDGTNVSTKEIHVVAIGNEDTVGFIEMQQTDGAPYTIDDFKPYLRPMSSMTEEEKKEYDILTPIVEVVFPCDAYPLIDWLNKKMFDYRGLIPMGLALEAPENMYNTKTE
jgi:hypothetical protein